MVRDGHCSRCNRLSSTLTKLASGEMLCSFCAQVERQFKHTEKSHKLYKRRLERARVPQINKTCITCHKPFSGIASKKTCSEECKIRHQCDMSKAYQKTKKQEPKIPKNCVVCGEQFLIRRNQKTCSDKCSTINAKNLRLAYYRAKKERTNQLIN